MFIPRVAAKGELMLLRLTTLSVLLTIILVFLAAVRLWNAMRKIQIHTVGVGDHDKDFLQRLAKQNNGTYVAR